MKASEALHIGCIARIIKLLRILYQLKKLFLNFGLGRKSVTTLLHQLDTYLYRMYVCLRLNCRLFCSANLQYTMLINKKVYAGTLQEDKKVHYLSNKSTNWVEKLEKEKPFIISSFTFKFSETFLWWDWKKKTFLVQTENLVSNTVRAELAINNLWVEFHWINRVRLIRICKLVL